MVFNKRRRWALVAGLAGVAGAQLAEQVLASSWRVVAKKDPRDEVARDNVDWKSAALWTAAAGAAAALSELIARRGAGIAWTRITGKKPPRHRRVRRTSRKSAA